MEKIILKTKEEQEILAKIKILDETYIDAIMKIQKEIIDNLEDKQIYAASDRSEFLDAILNKGKIIGVLTEENELIAMGVYMKNGYDTHNYGYDIGIEGDELLYVGQIESTVVQPKFRGNKLQKMICEKLEEIAKSEGNKKLCATASPYNKYSVNTFIDLGYEIKADKLKYGGLRRYVLVKEI